MDTAAGIGLATVGVAGLISLAGRWALLLLLFLTVTSPVVCRTVRDRGALLRRSLALVREVRARRPPYPSEHDDWP